MFIIDNWKVYNWDEYKHVGKADHISNKGKNKKTYCTQPMFLDTETSKVTHFVYNKTKKSMEEKPYASWIYQWALCIDDKFVVIGRKPSELCKTLKTIAEKNKNSYIENCENYTVKRGNGKNQKKLKESHPENYRTIVFVHNLPYDWSYLYSFFTDYLGESTFLASAPHKVFSVIYQQSWLEFRCSYKLTNKSLEKWSEGLAVPHAKLSGAIDYNVVRYQDSPLEKIDWDYQIYDVLSMYESYHKQIEKDGDDIMQLPYTSTGYVRRLIKRNFNNHENSVYMKEHDFIKKNHQLTMDTYAILRDCYSGAISTGNYKIYGEVIDGDIRHRDFTSHYPTQQICKLFPMGKLTLDYSKDECFDDVDLYNDILDDKENASFVRIIFKDLILREDVTIPYISESKLTKLTLEDTECNFISENGRVLRSFGYCLYNGTDLDLKWIEKQYDFDYEIIELYKSKLDKLPTYLLDIVNESFYGKSYYKMKVREAEKLYGEGSNELFDAYYDLMKIKNILNGIYGCTATDPIRDEIILNGNEWCTEKVNRKDKDVTNETFVKAIESYNKSMYLNYSAGVYCTALARDELMTCVELIGYDNILYCDTDSAFYLSTPEIESKLTELNKKWRTEAELNHYYVEVEGKKVYYHNFDEESPIRKFKTLHSKCYAMEVLNEKTSEYQLSCTIAGVKSKSQKWINGKMVIYDRASELGSIDNLKEGFVFKDTGTTSICYIDLPYYEDIIIDGHVIETSNGGVIMNQTQTLSSIEVNFDYRTIEVL